MRISDLGFDPVAVGLQESAELFGGWQGDEVAGDEEFLVHAGGGELDLDAVALAAEEDADRRCVSLLHHVGLEPIEIEIHLPGIGRLKSTDLHVDQHMTAEEAVVEDQIDAVVLAALGHAELASLETKAASEFEKETLQMIEQGGFEVRL